GAPAYGWARPRTLPQSPWAGAAAVCEVRRLRRGGRGEDFFRCCEGVFAVGGDQADAGAAVEEVGGVEGAFVLYGPEEVAAGQAEADRFRMGFDQPQGLGRFGAVAFGESVRHSGRRAARAHERDGGGAAG